MRWSIALLAVVVLIGCGPRVDATHARNAAIHGMRLQSGLRWRPVSPGVVQLQRNELDPTRPPGSWWRTGEAIHGSDAAERTSYVLIGVEAERILVAYESIEDRTAAQGQLLIDRGVVAVPMR